MSDFSCYFRQLIYRKMHFEAFQCRNIQSLCPVVILERIQPEIKKWNNIKFLNKQVPIKSRCLSNSEKMPKNSGPYYKPVLLSSGPGPIPGYKYNHHLDKLWRNKVYKKNLKSYPGVASKL